ncbi:hypothetical protein NE852_15365 [Rhizobium sp. Pop5]|uniref:hypothetical protein n=1 Tax=Rhizobium sp. Pop5 TaxID=1223565 RepID=UPI000283566D|nr:hypothetical protein [Rhizobium sp. Pop5]EJZ19572.1 hypothetical protein RCCGEPOP_19543 [Rhizobium sp. Pop5]UVD55470.1 hypothetical protein NE852_15365 [Rhizobium sp. Pop5]
MQASGWISVVAHWLMETFPESGIAAEWAALSTIDLGLPMQTPSMFQRSLAKDAIDSRLRWLAGLPTKAVLRAMTMPHQVNKQSLETGRREVKLALTSRAVVDPARIEALAQLSPSDFDLTKLIRLCEELNLAFATESYLSMAMLTRAIVDHVPPIFGKQSFAEVANNHGGATLKREFKNLDTTSRNIADLHLHSHIRRKEVLPTITQVDASNSLDVLLAEIIVILTQKGGR